MSIDRQYAQSPSPSLYKERLRLQTEFNIITTRQVEGCLIRTKSDFYEHGEKTAKILANQLRGIRAKQIIPGIKTDKGSISSDPKKINEHFKVFYSRLYTPESAACLSDSEAFFSTITVPSLSPDLRQNLVAPSPLKKLKRLYHPCSPESHQGLMGSQQIFLRRSRTISHPFCI